MIDAILRKIRPGATWNLDGDTYEGLQWTDPLQVKPTLAEINAEIANISTIQMDDEASRAINNAKQNRLLFEINFDQENRIRVLEAKPAINRTQYRNALVNTYKTL